MKKLFKVGAVVLVIGLIALGIGFFNHGNNQVVFNSTGPHIMKRQATRTIKVSHEFHNLNIDLSTANLNVVQGKKFQIVYHGINAPQVTVKNGTATIHQPGSGNNSFTWSWSSNVNAGDDTVTIVVPQGTTLAGKIRMSEGDLFATNISLQNVSTTVEEGDARFNNVLADGGQLNLDEGDFTAHHLTVQNHFKVVNDEGDNTVVGVTADGYYLRTDEGDNTLFHHEQDDDDDSAVLKQNNHAANVLTLISSEGDNSVH